MPIHINWHNNEQTVLRLVFEGKWTLEEFINAGDRVVQMYGDRLVPEAQMHVIVDARQSRGFPKTGNMIPHVQRIFSLAPDGLIVFVGGSAFGLALVRITLNLLPAMKRRVYFAETIEESDQTIATSQEQAMA